ncbi:MAG: coproporphyrinogen dehydrogenase HemZ [Lachnospiraceae bacterium]
MVTIQLKRTDFEYDIHSLIRAFYPQEEIKFLEEMPQDGEEISFHVVIHYLENKIEFEHYIWDASRFRESELPDLLKVMTVDWNDRKETKNALKKSLYQILSCQTKKLLPWGTLTGIRPTKIPMDLLEKGRTPVQIKEQMMDQYLISEEKADLCIEVAVTELEILSKLDYQNGYSLYIGIPFCPSTCLYCSFTSYPLAKWRSRVDEYLDALEKEILFTAETCKNRTLQTVYIGGGTPTSLEPAQLRRLIELLKSSFDLSQCVELTVEAGRPDSITREKLATLKELGITRISINPQTMKEETLKLIGRHHSVKDTIDSFQLARELGFDDINMDLIIGLPNESLEDVKSTLKHISDMAPDNLTVHSLAIKRAARLKMFPEDYKELSIENTDETIELTAKAAKEIGLRPYYLYRQKNMAGNFENVGYARPGQEGIYNILIMEEKQTILALGAGAASKFVMGNGRKAQRVENVKDIDHYLTRVDEMIEKKRSKMEELEWL